MVENVLMQRKKTVHASIGNVVVSLHSLFDIILERPYCNIFAFHVHRNERETRPSIRAHVATAPYLSISNSVSIIKMVVCSSLPDIVHVSCAEIN